MSSAAIALQKHEWIVILPDHEGVLQKRMQVRPDHLNALYPSIKSGFWKLGGAILEEVIKEAEGPRIKGSIMLAFAESKEDVIKALQEDVYFKQGVWDWNKVQIHPFKSTFRQPL
ncbi:hypothetical protein HO173_011391 [Letharia columbiana]|uniref:YCII-related domain-containing protein n=1 Tax=Letharia columbiana TaxID=112416 RepID=A0A8H6FJ79_9LECA|nr:uncharacterized protein HO173_011391 [Letharia columbiana]KAF6229536.1 hypothetical protein HO173_011391 [Letharia columbiana]